MKQQGGRPQLHVLKVAGLFKMFDFSNCTCQMLHFVTYPTLTLLAQILNNLILKTPLTLFNLPKHRTHILLLDFLPITKTWLSVNPFLHALLTCQCYVIILKTMLQFSGNTQFLFILFFLLLLPILWSYFVRSLLYIVYKINFKYPAPWIWSKLCIIQAHRLLF